MEDDYVFAKYHLLIHKLLLSMKKDIRQGLHGIVFSRVSVTIFLGVERYGRERSKRLHADVAIGDDLDQCVHDLAERLFREIERYKGCWNIKELLSLDVDLN